MYDNELKQDVATMFQELETKANEIIADSRTAKSATEKISEMVSSRITTESEGYIVDMYSALSKKIREEEYFKNPKHLNDFFHLNLREQLNEKYHFEITSIDTFKKGIEYKEVNSLYVAAGTAAGTFAVGGILKFAIAGVVHIPLAVIIAGAVAAGIAAYFVVPSRNKKNYTVAVHKYLKDLENDILNWLVEIEEYFNAQVRSLYQV